MITTIIKRNGTKVPFDPTKIVIVMKKAFAAEQVPIDDSALEQMTGRVVASLTTLMNGSVESPTVEKVQDLVENTLMERGYYSVAKAYILYRFQQSEVRKQEVVKEIEEQRLTI
jgi:anaerobic ribonucleoside-triphosphate reductase